MPEEIMMPQLEGTSAHLSRAPVYEFAALGSLSDSDRKELHFWKTDPLENPDGDLFDNLIAKSSFIKTFATVAPMIAPKPGQLILELGGGHCWASAMLKRLEPSAHVIASDVSPDAVAYSARYEELLSVTIDEKWAVPANQLPFADGSMDTVFAFAAFHHFIIGDRYAEVIGEIFRVLRSGGRAVFLYEPSASPFFYWLAHKRVNDFRSIDEDVVRLGRLRSVTEGLGGRMQVNHFPESRYRSGLKQTLYYAVLGLVPPLQRLLPCSVNIELIAP